MVLPIRWYRSRIIYFFDGTGANLENVMIGSRSASMVDSRSSLL
jgi:hypothetical protein